MKTSVFYSVTPLIVNRCFGGICGLHLHDRRISRVKNRQEILPVNCFMIVLCFSYSSILKMAAKYPSETSVDFQPDGVISQNIEVFITTAVRTSIPPIM